MAHDRAQPGADAAHISARAAAAGRRGRRVPAALRRGDRRRSTTRASAGTRGGASTASAVNGGVDRLLLGRVRPAPVAADLRRRPRRAGRRPLQGGQRPRRAAGRRRLHVPAGLLPPADVANDGWQEERYERHQLGRRADRNGDHARRQARASPRCRSAIARCWPRSGGSASAASACYLLDTDLEENAPWDRELSARLYGGDRETRIQQEVILGIGGVRVLRALGIEPAVWHLNEGHAAFVVLQRIREHVEQGASFDEALDAGAPDRRSSPPTRRCRPATTRSRSTWSRSTWPAAGASWASIATASWRSASTTTGSGSQFNMTALALRTAERVNAVSELHGEVTREMWQPMWPDRPVDGVPVRGITNGVHVPTWMAARPAVAARPPISATTGSIADRRSRHVGTASTTFPTTSCGRAATLRRRLCSPAIRERVPPALDGRTGRRRPASSPPARCSIPAR